MNDAALQELHAIPMMGYQIFLESFQEVGMMKDQLKSSVNIFAGFEKAFQAYPLDEIFKNPRNLKAHLLRSACNMSLIMTQKFNAGSSLVEIMKACGEELTRCGKDLEATV